MDAAVCNKLAGFAKTDAGVISMLEELRRQTEESDCKAMSAHQLIRQEYERKKSEIQKLIDSIRLLEEGSVSVQYINEEIRKLDRECLVLREQMETADGDESGQRVLVDYIQEASDKMTDFSKLLEELPVLQKGDFLREVIEKIIWDGEMAHIYLIGS